MQKTFNSNIFVNKIPGNVTEKEIRDVFGQVGKIISIKINQAKIFQDNKEIIKNQIAYILYD